jgi:6-pyruvoyltetrahydropterin/6-carboxytetrahydropterin synthase
MFQVTQNIEFCYGHRLLNYAGKCRHLHGHNGRAVIVLEGEKLDARGMLVDFTDIKNTVRTWIDTQLDHRMILNEQDPVVPFLREQGEPLFLLKENPTAETIAKVIFEYTQSQNLPVIEVSLWETPNSFATYREQT